MTAHAVRGGMVHGTARFPELDLWHNQVSAEQLFISSWCQQGDYMSLSLWTPPSLGDCENHTPSKADLLLSRLLVAETPPAMF